MNALQSKDYTKPRKAQYKKGGTAGIEGGLYQIHLLTLFLLKGLMIPNDWYLSTENDETGKFDDLVFESSDGDIFLQAKHKKKKKITYEDLLSTNSKNDDFSLPKYFFSYVEMKHNFNIKNVIICTNTDFKLDAQLKKHIKRQNLTARDMLHYEGADGFIYTFNDSIISELKEPIKKYYDENLQKKNIAKEIISNENITSFLNQLQLVINYPNKTSLDKAIEKIISKLEVSEKLDSKTSSNYIHKKMQDWFKQEKGVYLTKAHAKAFLCEIWSHEYCNALENFNLHFQNNELPFKDPNKKFWHIIAQGNYILNVLKIYHALQKRNEKEILLINPDYDNKIKRQIIQAFEVPSYTILIIICPKSKDKFVTQDVCNKIIDILNTYSYKRIVLIAEKDNTLINLIKNTNFYALAKEKILFSDIDKETEEIFIHQKNIVFQGKDTNLFELLKTPQKEDLDEIINSEILIKLAANDKINVGLEVTPLNEELENYYIPRSFKGNDGNISEEALYNWDENDEQKIILISDSAGMGKSTVLTNLANLIKRNSPNLWVLKVDINHYTKILWEFRENNRESIPIMELLNSQPETKFKSDFEKVLFSLPKMVVLMIDGVDEISPNYKEIVFDLILNCRKNHNFVKIFITTRPHLREELENLLQVASLILNPFSKEDEINFLCMYWTQKLDLDEDSELERCEIYAQKLVKEIPKWINGEYKQSFAGIPLQIRMLAEVFQEKKNLDDEHDEELDGWEGCHDFIISENDKPKLPRKINLVKLYQLFMNKKRFIFMYDKSKLSGNVIMSEGVTKVYEECQVYHHILALEFILNKNEIVLFNFYKKHFKQHLDDKNVVKLGIVQKIQGRFSFMHRTFAEFFVAECLLFELKSNVHSKEFQEFFIHDILLRVEFVVIRSFLDSFLQKEIGFLPAKTFEIYSFIDYESKLYDAMGITFLHTVTEEGCMYLLRFFFKCFELIERYVKINAVRDSFGKTLLHYASQKGYLDIVKFLVERGADVNIEDYCGCPPLHETISTRKLDILNYLLENGGDVNVKDGNDRTALLKATENVDLEMVKLLVDNGSDVLSKDEDGLTALHLASRWISVDIAKILLENGANIHSENDKGCTPLHDACEWGALDMAKFLVENGANVNVKDSKGYTALHKVALSRWNFFDMFKYMVKVGADVSIRDKDGCTVLHNAAHPEGLDIINFLLDLGENVDTKNYNGETALYLASRENYLDVVKFLVRKGSNVNIQNNYGRTPLHVAVQRNSLDVIKFLVESGAIVNIQDMQGCTILQCYHSNIDLDVIKFLTKKGLDVNNRNNVGQTAVHCATQRGCLDNVKFLVENGANINFRDKNGCTPLHYAIEKNSIDIAAFLINNGAIINILDENKCNELYKAAKQGNFNMIRLLIKKNAEVNTKNKIGRTALHEACENGCLDTVKFLIDSGANVNISDVRGSTALHECVSRGRLDMTTFLVKKGADINIANRNHYTAILLAILEGKFDLMNFLMKSGASISVKNKDGSTALHLAARWGNLDMIKLLIENNININSIGENDCTALHIAARWNSLDKVQCLVGNGADVNIKDKDGCTALHAAVRPGSLALVKFLAEKYSDINAANSKGQTPLHEAVARGCLNENEYINLLEVIKFLIGEGANINIKNKNGRTVLHAAAIEGRLDIVQLLVQSNADVNVKDVQNLTALDYANQKGYLQIVELLQENAIKP